MTRPEKKIVTADIANKAVRAVRAWEAGERKALVCPICAAEGLQIVDRSARPHMSWYILTCASCGLDEPLALPEGAHGAAID